MRTYQPIAPQVQQAMDETRAWLTLRLLAIAHSPAFVALVGADRAKAISAELATPDGLPKVSHQVREAIVAGNSGPNGILWDVIDAIGTLLDTTFGRWAYMTDDGRLRNLGWCREGVHGIESALLATIQPEAIAA